MNRPQGFEREQGPGGIEVRALARAPRTRAAGDDTAPVIAGYGAVTGVVTTIEGWFSEWDEEIAPGAFADSLDGDADVRSMFNHDTDRLLGRSTAGSLRLEEDSTGLAYEVDINTDDPNAMSVHAQVARGDVSGSSIWFYVAAETWEYPDEDNGLERAKRTITRIKPLVETGPVVFPAFTTTTAAARSFGRLAPPTPDLMRSAPEPEGPPRYSSERYRRQKDHNALAALMGGHPLPNT